MREVWVVAEQLPETHNCFSYETFWKLLINVGSFQLLQSSKRKKCRCFCSWRPGFLSELIIICHEKLFCRNLGLMLQKTSNSIPWQCKGPQLVLKDGCGFFCKRWWNFCNVPNIVVSWLIDILVKYWSYIAVWTHLANFL